jgi:hypothetical protein
VKECGRSGRSGRSVEGGGRSVNVWKECECVEGV